VNFCTYVLPPLLFFGSVAAASISSTVDNLVEEFSSTDLQVDLKDPTFSNGVLETTHGGVVSSPDLRIQGLTIRYTKKKDELTNNEIAEIQAEGSLLIEFKDRVFVGQRIVYDFITKTGHIIAGKTAVEPWFVGGERIDLLSDGSFSIHNGFFTTSENEDSEWKISFEHTTLGRNNDFSAWRIRFLWQHYPFVYFPRLKANLNDITDMPLRIYGSLGGRLGPKATVLYKLYAKNGWKNFLRVDYRLNKGPGLGIESFYRSQDRKTAFQAINYVAKDSSLEDPHEQIRYRLQGNYSSLIYDDKISVHMSYDKLSDQEMPTDYSYSSIDLKYAGITRLHGRWQEQAWIANFLTTVRVNDFQTLKEQLPAYELHWHPYTLGNTGIISDHRFKAGYLDFKYADEVTHAHDYHSTRVEYFQRLYRRLCMGAVHFIPEGALLSIYYENPRRHNGRWLNMGLFSFESNMPLYRTYNAGKHVLTPYMIYRYTTAPTLSPDDHYIFDINDGWCRLNLLQIGTRSSFYWNNASSCWNKHLSMDIYGNGYINTRTQPVMVPKVYAKATWQLNPYMQSTIDTAWDFQFNHLDHINVRADWTISDDFAIATEYRHRSAMAWRKADPTNFMLESCRTTKELLNSPLSDRRDTLLLRCFYRLTPTWATEFQLRHGWNRKKEPSYTECECDLIGVIQRAWQLRFSYQHKENDHRFAVYLNFGLKRPVQGAREHHVPTLSF
jgi:hypothetical protein